MCVCFFTLRVDAERGEAHVGFSEETGATRANNVRVRCGVHPACQREFQLFAGPYFWKEDSRRGPDVDGGAILLHADFCSDIHHKQALSTSRFLNMTEFQPAAPSDHQLAKRLGFLMPGNDSRSSDCTPFDRCYCFFVTRPAYGAPGELMANANSLQAEEDKAPLGQALLQLAHAADEVTLFSCQAGVL